MEISRRTCLSAIAGLIPALGTASSHRIHVGCQTNAWPIQPSNPATLFRSLQQIQELQFQGFETGFRNLSALVGQADMFRQHTGGLAFFGVHIFLTQYDPQTLVAPLELAKQVVEQGAKFGAQRLILSGAPASDPAALKQKANALNRIAALSKASGLGFGYHNHGPEFKGSPREIDGLLAQTDPSLVSLVMDAGHAFRAGADVPAFIEKNSQRLTGLHLRDFSQGKQVPLGSGDFPLQAVAKALAQANYAGWILAEEEREDGSKPAEQAAGPARAAIKKWFEV